MTGESMAGSRFPDSLIAELAGRRVRKARAGVALVLLFLVQPLPGASERAVQVMTGRIDADTGHQYVLAGLKRGDALFVRAQGISGNFDPLLFLLRPEIDFETLGQKFLAKVEQARASGRDLLSVAAEMMAEISLAWNDDASSGYAAAITFNVPEDGDYRLVVRSALAGPTYGGYRLIVGLNAPEALSGQAKDTGRRLAFLDRKASRLDVTVQEVNGTLPAGKPATFYRLNPVSAKDTLYVRVEATSGDLKPGLFLDDYGGKPLLSSNSSGRQPQAALKYTFNEDAPNFSLRITGRADDGTATSGDFRLVAGLNSPEVLAGTAAAGGPPLFRQPTIVKIGIQLDQITSVNQKEQNISVAATLQMRWQDRALAFSPETCQCRFKKFDESGFARYASQCGTDGPTYSLFNQQGRRNTQNLQVIVWPGGDVIYAERFSATLQAPDLDFRRFPFDRQVFAFHIDSTLPREYFVFEDLTGYTQVGAKLGHAEFVVSESGTDIKTWVAPLGEEFSRFSFRFATRRHLNYYIFRIFLPLLLILTVSWVTFFLRDYRKRIDVSSGLLFVLVAFNFTISSDLPRLGYMTLIDAILVSAFIVTILIVIVNVYLRRLEAAAKEERAKHIDKYILWLFPVGYVLAIGLSVLLFG
jgi:hypothetical protein